MLWQEEASKQSGDLGIPYWRTLKAHGFLNGKYLAGAEAQKALVERDGFGHTWRKEVRCSGF